MKLLSRFLSLFLIPLLIVLPLQAQLPAPEPANPALRLLLKSATTAVVNSPAASGFLVEVTDAKGAPVLDAAVYFRLPDEGVTGTFADGSHAAVAYTDATGQAYSPALRWGATPGSANVRITAAKGPLHAGLLVEEILQSAPNPRVPGALPISAPQLVIVSVPNPILPSPAVANPAAPDAPAFHPAIPDAAVSKPANITKSGAAPAPVVKPEPAVSITNTPDVHPHSNKKWLILALIGVGAGVGAALAMKGKGSTPATAATANPPIGAPTVSVGGSH
ncbi:MAG TPA: hypothetical protein VGG97_13760 [Bryobacteraceae bacterium]|jgi:hypothetical protein